MANRYVSHSTHTVFVGHRMWVLSVAPCLSKNTKSTTHAKRWQGRVKPNLAGPDKHPHKADVGEKACKQGHMRPTAEYRLHNKYITMSKQLYRKRGLDLMMRPRRGQ